MKRFFTFCVCMFIISMNVMAQHSEMKFAGPSRFGIESMNAWQDNTTDTIVFIMNSTSEADITLPAMTYKAMNTTIPSFTIHSAKFNYDYTTRNATFDEQSYEEALTVNGEEKNITGSSLTASYQHSDNSFTLKTVLSYGKMPFPVTYTINAIYVSTAGILNVAAENNNENTIYSLTGQKITSPAVGHIYIVNGKKKIF